MQEVQRLPEFAIPERRSVVRTDALVGVLLILVMVIGGYFRFTGLNWDDFTHLHPDERFLTDVAQGLGRQLSPSGDSNAAAAQMADCLARYPDSGGMGPYFDTECSALNPLNANSAHGLYVYGTLPLFITEAAADFTVQATEWYAHNILARSNPIYATYDGSQWATYDGIQLVWRFLSALAEMGIILIVFVIGTKLHDKWIGLLAAFFYSVTVFSIQMAHFGTVDAMANLFSALSILFAVLVQREGKLINYALFGVFFGCAVASRINLVPLAALIAIAALIQIMPAFESRLAPGERSHALIYHGGGLLLAAFLSLLAFRIFNPYAFNGPGFFGLSLNSRWLDNMNYAQALNAGIGDSPPNYQWVARLPYIFPLDNMVLWGIGIPLGIIAWLGWLWSGYRLVRGKPGAINNAVLVVWVLIYFGWLGRNWVTTMRYFLPLYPVLMVLAAWALVSLVRYARGHLWRRRFFRVLLYGTAVIALLWSAMFTNVYRHLLTRVQATYWVWEHVPGDFAMQINSPDDPAPVINIGLPNNGIGTRHVYDDAHAGSEHQFTAPVTGTISAVYIDYMDDPNHDLDPEMIYFTITRVSDNQQMADAVYSGDLTHAQNDQLPPAYTIPFTQFEVQQGELYQLNVLLISGGPVVLGSFVIPIQPDAPSQTPLINIPLMNNNYGGSDDDLVSRVTRLDSTYNSSASVSFTAPASGTVTSIYAPHLGDPNDDPQPEVLQFTITKSGDSTPLATATLNTNLPRDENNILGTSYNIPLDAPLEVTQGDQYDFNVQLVSGGAVISGGSVFTWEGAWDDPVPTGVCALPIGTTLEDDPAPGIYMDRRDCKQWLDPWYGLVNGYEQNIVYEDEPSKRDHLLLTLDNSDYLAITSNRFYDPMARNPMRWPLTNFYYQQLFAGKLGYDLVATFQETFQLGPLRISDQYLPTYTGPKWLNELESEEAFSVYDHPVVFIFQKRADYSAEQVHQLLDSVPLTRVGSSATLNICPGTTSALCDPTIVNVATLSSDQAAKAPTDLQFTSAMQQIQSSGGTWSDRFDETSIVNTNPVAAVVIWWLTIMVFGFAAFPLLFVLLPGFADRGYAFAKFAGMLLAGWGTWYLASLRIPVWSQVGIAGAMLLLFLIGLALMWRRRDAFVDFLREHWKRLALIELITLIAFLAFVGVRLTNPDLWQPTFGGEKPMDFAYFNGVLRSTIFPPIDPWYSGGYINYYYFGYVIVGTPVLLLKMIPSIAYNLILPTLFALTGISAFSVAFTLVNSLRERVSSDSGTIRRVKRLGNPWVAGIAALMLAVVLGNLDTPHVFLSGVANAGGYAPPPSMQDYLIQQYSSAHDGNAPDDATLLQIAAEAQSPPLSDQVQYEISTTGAALGSLLNGFSKMLSGQALYVSPDRWFWGPTRVLAEPPVDSGGAIAEMPIFTYVYGDMHAHMIAMPMQLAVMGLILNEVLLAGSDLRRRRTVIAALAVLGIYVGMLRATNTWDWVTFMLLSVVGLVFAWWLGLVARDPDRSFMARFTRRSLIGLTWYLGGFALFSLIAALPYNMWFASAYNSVSPWTDAKTPLWAYFDIHGLFLFLVVSLLVWDTARWLRSLYVRQLRGTWLLLISGLVILAVILLGSLMLAVASYQVTLVVLPLLIWIALLFFRSGQSRVMQFVLILTGLALGLTLGVEYVVLDGDIGRQNTVFKFYIQAWLLLSVVGGAAFAWLIAHAPRWRPGIRSAWMFVAVALIGVASLFPIMAIRGKAAFRFDLNTCAPTTLDGMDYMKCAMEYEGDDQLMAQDPTLAPFPLSEDYAMIRWLQDHVRGTPTIIEGLSERSLYVWNDRIAIYTGLPTVIGWNFHQKQQRSLDPFGQLVDDRIANVNDFYDSTSIDDAWRMLQYYHVTYVIVGRLEQAYYQQAGLAKFPEMAREGLLIPVFQQGESTIYRVNQDATLQVQG